MAWYRTRTEVDEATTRPGGGGFGLALLLIVVLVVGVLFVSGAMYLRNTEGTTEIILDKQKLEQSADKAADQGKEVLRKTGEKLQEIGQDKSDPAAQ